MSPMIRKTMLRIPLVLIVTLALLLNPTVATAQEPEHPDHPDESEPLDTQPESLVDISSVPGMSESWNCGRPGFYMPLAEEEGYLSDDYLWREPVGALFGRTIGSVRSNLVDWVPPNWDDGKIEQVHQRVKPTLDRVSKTLADHAQQGRIYEIRGDYSWGFAPRAIRAGGSLSFHSFGTAIDINADTNPYRTDGVLVTDMPDWFVDSFRDEGMCWGGDWVGVKDAMHYSWMGPIPGGLAQVPIPYPPLTTPSDFTDHVASIDPTFPGPTDGIPYMIADGSGDGSADVVRIRSASETTAALEIARSRAAWDYCGVWYWELEDFIPGDSVDFADVDASGRRDVLTLRDDGDRLVVRGHLAATNYDDAHDFPTEIDLPANATVEFADINRDGRDDLWVINPTDGGLRIRVYSGQGSPGVKFTEKIRDVVTPIKVGSTFEVALGDHDVDGHADLWVMTPTANGQTRIRIAHHGSFDTVAEDLSVPAPFADTDSFAVTDYDGDGRVDLYRYGRNGKLDVWLGNSRLPGVAPESWFMTPGFTCDTDAPDLSFTDTAESVFVEDIEWLAAEGITLGCNPPANDRFCPDDSVTRGQMAAFLVRALDLPATTENAFVDDGGSVFEDDINRLAASGITRGCNPPANDRFCVNDHVTRGQMAAFLVRAYELVTRDPSDLFIDDNGSIFEPDIERLATAKVTLGCNPPANDRFCPDDHVTRGQMAAFLHRAADLP